MFACKQNGQLTIDLAKFSNTLSTKQYFLSEVKA